MDRVRGGVDAFSGFYLCLKTRTFKDGTVGVEGRMGKSGEP